MILSTTCKAALKSVIFLSTRFGQKQNSNIREIAQEVGENEHTVAKLLQTLVRQNIIRSSKGPSGGFYIDEEQLSRPILDIVEAIDGKQVFGRCGLGLKKCSRTHPCPIHYEYQEARELIEKIFSQKKVSELSIQVQSGESFLSD